jgi:hypothetical protein
MEAKHRFVVSPVTTGRFALTELCADFHISRKTGHKGRRHQIQSPKTLQERSALQARDHNQCTG